MKYSKNCGAQLDDSAAFCTHCGCATDNFAAPTHAPAATESDDTLNTVAKVFMVLGCLSVGWTLIPLIWCIPMTVSFFGKVRDRRKVGTGFKVCTLLFVNVVAGIVMLCRNEDKYYD